MRPLRWIGIVLCGGAFTCLQGCTSTVDITQRTQLLQWSKTGPIMVLTKDSTLYRLEYYTLKASDLDCEGTAEKKGTIVPFKGTLPLTEIQYAQARETSFLKSLVAIGAVGYAAYAVKEAWNSPQNGSVGVAVGWYSPYSGGGGGGGSGSCPFVSVWDGKQYQLEGEAFSVALGKGLELSTIHMLPRAVTEKGELRLRISNERPETHHINSVRVFAAETERDCQVFTDPAGTFWPVNAAVPPVTAIDRSGRNVAEAVAEADGVYWTSDAAAAAPGGDFEDRIHLTFARPQERGEASLVVRAINTRISEVMVQQVSDFLGDQSLPFLYRLEHDPALLRSMRAWTEDLSLKVEMWDGAGWTSCGRIIPEATEVAFTHVVRVTVPFSVGPTLTLRLRALCDVWQLDATMLDWSEVKPLPVREMNLLSAEDSQGNSVLRQIEKADDAYVTVLPPGHVDLAFSAERERPGLQPVYAARVQGYLYEWFRAPRATAASGPISLIPSEQRLDYLQQLIAQRQLFLPPIYAEWKHVRNALMFPGSVRDSQ